MNQSEHVARRHFLAQGLLASASFAGSSLGWTAPPPRRPRVAAIYTVFHHRSHAHNFLEKCLRPYLFNGKVITPPVEVVSFYSDQTAAKGDMTQEVSRQFRIPVFKTIAEALTLGGKELAVDAVLSIGEQGNYPVNKLGQQEYPRKRFFDEIVAVMRRSNRFVPLFNDKHLSYRWDWSREMYDTCRKHGIPFMAGSSVPLAQRIPALELPPGADIEEAIAVHGGPVESYDFHGLEILQSLVEARCCGESGVAAVEFLTGAALWQAARQGRWSVPLAEAALAAEFGNNVPNIRQALKGEGTATPHAILITYRDGFKGTVLKVGQSSVRWLLACKLAGDRRLRATRFYAGPWGNRCLFMALTHAILDHFVNRRSPYPVERTLLTTGIVEATVRSRAQGQSLQTPHLNIPYQPRDFRSVREMGASWKVLAGTPEATGINPLGKGKKE